MSSLETAAEERAEPDADDDQASESSPPSAAASATLDDADVRLSVPESATPAEAAAVAAAVSAHRTDRRRAAAAAAATDDEPDWASRWKVAARLPERWAVTIPRDVERGALWQAASRSL